MTSRPPRPNKLAPLSSFAVRSCHSSTKPSALHSATRIQLDAYVSHPHRIARPLQIQNVCTRRRCAQSTAGENLCLREPSVPPTALVCPSLTRELIAAVAHGRAPCSPAALRPSVGSMTLLGSPLARAMPLSSPFLIAKTGHQVERMRDQIPFDLGDGVVELVGHFGKGPLPGEHLVDGNKSGRRFRYENPIACTCLTVSLDRLVY